MTYLIQNRHILTIGLSNEQNEILQKYGRLNHITLSTCRSVVDAVLVLGKETICLVLFNAVEMRTGEVEESVVRIRNFTLEPLIVLTRSENAQAAYQAGADACVFEPIEAISLLTISIAQIRRNEQFSQYDRSELGRPPLYRGDLIIDPMRHSVMRSGREIRLLPREFRLLSYFARNPGIVLNAEQLGNAIWSSEHNYNRDIAKVVSDLRRKLDDNRAKHIYIETIHGVGYRFIPTE